MGARKGDDNKTFFNSDRFFNEGGKWFFTTREGQLMGPYDSRKDAEQELMLYLRSLEERAKFGLKP
ncbi:MAG: DUF6316 family protein [Alcanivoracaceae bacterium]|jgi:hypothetical protein|nr:DUF6316 family protein [Alcanivoracaceae bacterium]